MSNRESFDMLNSIVNKLLITYNRLEISQYIKIIKQVMIDNYIDPDTKYRVGIDIINTYFDLKKQLMRYTNSVKHYHNKSIIEGINIKNRIERIIGYQYSIVNHLNEITEWIHMFDIESYRYKDNKNNKMIGFINIEDIKTFQDLLENLENFKIIQFNLYNADNFYLSRIYVKKHINYENTFENILDRYIERMKWVEKELMKIKYSNYIGIEYSLSDATEKINNCIEEYNKIDQDGMEDGIIFDNNLKVYEKY